MNIRLGIFSSVLALSMCACASSSIVVGTTRAPIDPSQVRIYVDPPERFEKVALLDAGSRNSWALSDQGKTNKVVQRLKAEAASLGANGVLLSGVGDQQVGSVGSGQAWGYGNTAYGFGVQSGVFQKKGQGLAIFVEEGAERNAVPTNLTSPSTHPPAAAKTSDGSGASAPEPASNSNAPAAEGWRKWSRD